MNQYSYIKAERGKDSLEYAVDARIERLTKDSLVIKDRKTFKYMIFDNCEQFEKTYNGNHSCDEVIFNWQSQKPKYDIDDWNNEQLEIINYKILEYFIVNLNIFPQIYECDSSGYDTELKRWKNSSHIIITNYAFKNANDAAIISNEIRDLLPKDCQSVFDKDVNKSIQHFRTPLSVKNGNRHPIKKYL